MRHKCAYFGFALLVSIVTWNASPICFGDDEGTTIQQDGTEAISKSVRALRSKPLLEILQRSGDSALESSSRSDLALATAVIASAENEAGIVEKVKAASPDDAATLKTIERLPLNDLAAQPVEVNPAEVPFSILALAKQSRRSLLLSALRGDSELIDAQLKNIESSKDLPLPVKVEISRFGTACKAVAAEFEESKLAKSLTRLVSLERRVEVAKDLAFSLLGDYRTDPDNVEVPRGEGANAYSLMIEKEKQRVALITAYTAAYKAYVRGEKTKVETIRELQKAASAALDLKEKRATMYWTMKKLRAEELKQRREATITRNERLAAERESQTAADLSPSWPTLLSHRDLRPHAAALRNYLNEYSPQNCGQFSACYAKSVAEMRALHRLLTDDIDGLTLTQRAGLVRYLRKLEEELKRPYSRTGYIACLNSAKTPTRESPPMILVSRPIQALEKVQPTSLSLGGDDTDLASYALYRSLLASLVKAGQTSDRAKLTLLAEMIRESDLLTRQQKASLSSVGSQIYTGKLTAAELEILEEPEEVLANIAGVSGDDTNAALDVPDDYQEKAFDLLISATLEASEA